MMGLSKVVEARLSEQVEEVSIADTISTRAEERTGYSARFAPVIAGNVKKYTGKVEYDVASVSPITLELKNKDYFAFGLSDIERIKTNPVEIDKTTKGQAREIAAEEDRFILRTLVSGAGKTVTKSIEADEDAYNLLVEMNQELSKKNAPMYDRFLVVDFDTLGRLSKDTRFTHNYEILENGVVEGATINGSTLLVSNNLPKDTIVAVQKDGVGFERFLDQIETLRLQDAFSDGVRGLSVYDGVVLVKNFVVAGKMTAAETK